MEDHLFHKALHMAGTVACQVKLEDMKKPTPCSEWDVEELLNHILNEVAWIPPLLEGKTIAEVGDDLDGDLIKGDPDASWHRYARAAVDAAASTPPDAVAHLSYADKTVDDYLGETGVDVIVHGWDLAKAIGADYMIDEATVEAALKAVKDVLPMARQTGYVGNEITVSSDAEPAERLLAAYGRTFNWAA